MKWSHDLPYSNLETARTVLVIRQAEQELQRERERARLFLLLVLALGILIAFAVRAI